MQADENETQNAINPEVKNVVSNGNKHLKETNEKKEKRYWLCSGMWDRAHLLLPSGENEDGGESHPADEGQKTHAAQTYDTNKTSSRAADSLFQHTRTTKEIVEVDKKYKYVLRCLCPSLSLSHSLYFSVSLFLFLLLARAREGTWEKRENLKFSQGRQQRQQSCRQKRWTGVVVFSKQLRIRTRDLVSERAIGVRI